MDANDRKMRRLVRRYNAMRALALLGWFLFLLMFAWHSFTWPRRQAVAIEVNGQPVVWLRDEGAANSARELLLSKQRGNLPGKALLRPENIKQVPGTLPEGQELASVEQAAQALQRAGVTVVVEAWAFQVGGKTVAIMATKENAEGIREGLKQHYVKGETVGEVAFEPKVEVSATTAPPDQIETDIAAAVQKVTTAHEGFVTYVVKSGDAPNSIAARFGLTLPKLTESNPSLKQRLSEGKPIFPGDKLRIPQQTKGLTVIWQKRVTEERETRYGTIRMMSPNVAPGEKRIVQPGKKGRMKVTALQTWHNDKMVGEKIQTKQVIEEPVAEKVTVHGTPP